ncbi:MAG: DUF2254 family protein, partial [Bryobacteraceae bacterium]
ETLKVVDSLFPEKADNEQANKEEADDREPPAFRPDQTWTAIPARETGYIQDFDTALLLEFACANKTTIRIERAIGEFLIEGTPVLSTSGAGPFSASDGRRLSGACLVGRQRTIERDPGFGIRQLVDVGIKALSPGVNDTTTAVMCVDYLTAILVRVADRPIAVRSLRSEDGVLRVAMRGPTFASLIGESFDQIRQNAGGNVAVIDRMLWSVETLADQISMAARRRVLLSHARKLEDLARLSIPSASDREPIVDRANRVIALLNLAA